MNWSEYADAWLDETFGKEGREITEWELAAYAAAIINYKRANREERRQLRNELLKERIKT